MAVMIKRMYNIFQGNNISKGHTANIVTICRRYNLMWTVIEASESGVYMTKAEWKRCAPDAVLENDNKRLQITCRMYNSLTQYTLMETSTCLVDRSLHIMCLRE